ncbi:MAG: dTDP-4-dehydrorhamnose reductase [Candidatus Omnitrophica bacterium 4484_70.1]|nr:MAG: dTDP-4-dehydrorhamnose reductase [Candidatus Omnitrophica bacterium 4484_70.1]
MKGKKFLITGSEGQLGTSFQEVLSKKGIEFYAPNKQQLNITDFGNLCGMIDKVKPDVILNCAAYNAVDEAEENPSVAYATNSNAVEDLATLCQKKGIFLVHFSSDYVFDGTKKGFYTEEEIPNPLNVYGKSKLKGEEAIKRILKDYLIFRVSWVFGEGTRSFLYKVYQWAKKEKVIKISGDEVSVPTYTEDIANLTLLSLEKGLIGLYHLTNNGYASRYEWAKYFLLKLEIDSFIIPVPQSSFATKAKRPLVSCMSNKKLSRALNIDIPYWENAVNRFVLKFEGE